MWVGVFCIVHQRDATPIQYPPLAICSKAKVNHQLLVISNFSVHDECVFYNSYTSEVLHTRLDLVQYFTQYYCIVFIAYDFGSHLIIILCSPSYLFTQLVGLTCWPPLTTSVTVCWIVQRKHFLSVPDFLYTTLQFPTLGYIKGYKEVATVISGLQQLLLFGMVPASYSTPIMRMPPLIRILSQALTFRFYLYRFDLCLASTHVSISKINVLEMLNLEHGMCTILMLFVIYNETSIALLIKAVYYYTSG